MDFLTDLLRDGQERLKRAYENTPPGIAVALLACIAGVLAVFFLFPYSEGSGATGRHPLFTIWKGLIDYSKEDWMHCFIVPWIALGLAMWQLSLAPLRKPSGGAFWALGGVLFFLLLFFAGYRIAYHYVGFYSLIGVLIFSVAYTAGTEATLRLAFPLVFLVFAVPMPFLQEVLAFPLRIIMSNASVAVLNLLGADVVRQGTAIFSAPVTLDTSMQQFNMAPGARLQLDVADPCSGIRSLYILLMMSALYGHFAFTSLWKKGLLFLTAIPFAVLGNIVRILILAFGTLAFGSEFAVGRHALTDPSWFHTGAGLVVLPLALLGMILVATILRGEGGMYWRKFTTALSMASEAQPPAPAEGKEPSSKPSDHRDERDIY